MPNYEALFAAGKTLGGAPQWFFDDGPDPIFTLTVSLDVDFVTVEGLLLVGHCRTADSECDVSLSLVHKPAIGLSGPFSRYDWNPHHDHSNNGLGPAPWARKLIVATTHLHPFGLNYTLGWERMARDNLPIAEPIAENPPNFREMLADIGKIFTITDIQRIPVPDWTESLF